MPVLPCLVAMTCHSGRRCWLGRRAWSTRRPAGDVTIPFLIDWDKVENDYRLQLCDALSPWIKLYPDVDVSCVVDRHTPNRALLNHAGDAQLVVVGSRGSGRLDPPGGTPNMAAAATPHHPPAGTTWALVTLSWVR